MFKNKNLQKCKILLILVILVFALSPSAFGYSATRTFGRICPSSFTVNIEIQKASTPAESFFTVDEHIPTNVNIVDPGSGSIETFGADTRIKWFVTENYGSSVILPYTLSAAQNIDIAFTGSTYQIGVYPTGTIANSNIHVRTNTCIAGGTSQFEWSGFPLSYSDDADTDTYGRGCTCAGFDCNLAQTNDNNKFINPAMQEGYVNYESLLCNNVDDDCSNGDCCRGHLVAGMGTTPTSYSCADWHYYDTYCTNKLEKTLGSRASQNELNSMIQDWLAGSCSSMTIDQLFAGFANMG